MIRRCPSCGSINVRRSTIHTSDRTPQHILRSPYRCHDCRERFWVFSRNAYYFGGAIAVVIVTAIIAWSAWSVVWSAPGTPDDRRGESDEVAPNIARFADTIKLAEKNDPLAEYKLAQMYTQGYGVDRDKQVARKWLERAAQHGHAEAQYELGLALLSGRDVVQDFERSAEWLRKAAASGNANAQFELGRMYLAGMGLPVDSLKAYIWLNLAVAGGIERAVSPRDAVLRVLSPAQVVAAQAEARRLTEAWSSPKTATK